MAPLELAVSLAILLAISTENRMRFASVAEVKDGFSEYLARKKLARAWQGEQDALHDYL